MVVSQLLLAASLGALAAAENYRSPTPPMGWNSYNYYNCFPNETIIKSNADGLVSSGLAALGYTMVTTDCGWPDPKRDAQGKLQFNPKLFPSGGKALGEYIHARGLKYGLYSGGGYYQCGGDVRVPASLGKNR
jgi:alpha-galactosidase